MKGWIRWTWIGCVVALALGVPVAHAQGGTITFVGAIAAPTCGAMAVSEAAPNALRGGCGAPLASVASRSSVYRQSTVSLEDATQAHDRLLMYFATYADAGEAHLVTRTYE
ncbi:hypothetical protein [Dyella jiangningensis]|uniref:Type 1 fimbrial protein n=1 Tax=Dyella jiangningensis TaxID=1379159 RepID=A0A328P8L3_9GAMM|nr:hypothetical protein [Dyella jiangningensis]RAO76634.1 hypothetical protein CA260_01540 [Dyella jiangningensis]